MATVRVDHAVAAEITCLIANPRKASAFENTQGVLLYPRTVHIHHPVLAHVAGRRARFRMR